MKLCSNLGNYQNSKPKSVKLGYNSYMLMPCVAPDPQQLYIDATCSSKSLQLTWIKVGKHEVNVGFITEDCLKLYTFSLSWQKLRSFWTEKFARGNRERTTNLCSNNFSETLLNTFGAHSAETSRIVSRIRHGASSLKIVDTFTLSVSVSSPSSLFFDGGGYISSNASVIFLKMKLHKLLHSRGCAFDVTSKRHCRTPEKVS